MGAYEGASTLPDFQSAILGPVDDKTLLSTFAAVSDANFKAQNLAIQKSRWAQSLALKGAALDLREQQLGVQGYRAAVSAQGQGIVNQLRQQKFEETQRQLEADRDYNEAVTSASKDGQPLSMRLQSKDPAVRDAAVQDLTNIRDRFAGRLSPVGSRDLSKYWQIPIVSQKLGQADTRLDQGQERLDQQENILDETVRHHEATEGIGQQNADTRREGADTRQQGEAFKEKQAGGEGVDYITIPGQGRYSMDRIRTVLARPLVDDKNSQAAHQADVLRRSLLQLQTKNADGTSSPRFKTEDTAKWAQEGQALLKKPVEPALPTKDPVVQPPVPTPIVTPPGMAPAATPSPADTILNKYKIRPPAPAATPAPGNAGASTNDGSGMGGLAISDGINPDEYSSYLSSIGLQADTGDDGSGPAFSMPQILQGDQSGQPVGFGGFGLQSAA